MYFKGTEEIRAMISMEVQSTVHLQHLNHSHGLSSLQSQHQTGLMHQHQLVQDEKPPKSKFNLRFFCYLFSYFGLVRSLEEPNVKINCPRV